MNDKTKEIQEFLFEQLDELLQHYVAMRERVTQQPAISYSVVEIAKMDIGDWILNFLDVNPDFSRKPEPEPARTYQKQAIPAELRWRVWERDNFTCRGCGARTFLSVDHIVAESRGGSTTLDNLQTLCKPCNSRKGSR